MAEPQGKQNFGMKMLNFCLCASNDPDAPRKNCGRKCIDCLKPTSDFEEENENQAPERESWGNRLTFFVTTLGMSVGLGQVWRFPTLAYKNGGGAFMIIYGFMIFFFGNALFFFEVSNGQYTSKNPLNVYDKVPLFIGIGWSMIVYSYLFCTYYSHMVSFSFLYLSMCFTFTLPWSVCPIQDDNVKDSYECMPYTRNRDPNMDGIVCGSHDMMYNRTLMCLNETYAEEQKAECCASVPENENQVCQAYFDTVQLCRKRQYPSEYYWSHTVNRLYREDDPMYGYLGSMNWKLLGTSFISWLVAYLILYKGLKSLGLLMYIMVPLPYVVLLIMFGVMILQDGAVFGLGQFFVPKMKNFYDVNVWRIATEQAFYSIGVAMGPLITFGSYAKYQHPTHIDGTLLCLCIFLTSLLCSSVVFSVLGFLSVKTGRPFEKVVDAGPGLVFIVYPESLRLLPGAAFFSFLFYLMLINLGLSTITGIIETVPSAIYDIWPKFRKYKYLVNLVVLSSCFIIGIPITCRGGLTVYNAFDVYAAGLTLLPICAIEMLIICVFYGLGRFCEDIAFMIGYYPGRYYRYQWIMGPGILLAVFIYGLVVMEFPDQKLWSILLGWLLFALVVLMIIIGMFYEIFKYKKQKNLKDILKPPPNHGPKKQSDREAREAFTTARKIF